MIFILNDLTQKLKLYCNNVWSDLCCNVGILFPVPITVVGVDVVRAHHAVHRLQDNPAVVVGDNIGVPAMVQVFIRHWGRCSNVVLCQDIKGLL